MQSSIKVKGTLKYTLLDEFGNIKFEHETHNLVTNAGLNLVASRLGADTNPPITYMAVGSDATAESVGQTALGTELGRVAVVATPSGATNSFVGTFGAGTGTGSIAEAGLFNGTPAGTMFSRTTGITVTKGALDVLVITWDVTVA